MRTMGTHRAELPHKEIILGWLPDLARAMWSSLLTKLRSIWASTVYIQLRYCLIAPHCGCVLGLSPTFEYIIITSNTQFILPKIQALGYRGAQRTGIIMESNWIRLDILLQFYDSNGLFRFLKTK